MEDSEMSQPVSLQTLGKTRKIRNPAQVNRGEPNYNASSLDIRDFYKSLFEKMGWMILAKSNGMNAEVANYKKSLELLRQMLYTKGTQTLDKPMRDDLNIMISNVNVLLNHAI